MSPPRKTGRGGRDAADVDQLIDEILLDAYGDDEQLWAFRQAFEDNVTVPCDGFVVGEPVSVVRFDYDGNLRRGLTARCRRADGSEHVVAAADVVLPEAEAGSRSVAAYRQWLGLEPVPTRDAPPARKRQHKATANDVDLTGPIELVVLSVKENAARCRAFEMEQVLPGADPDEPDTDPILESNDLKDSGDLRRARAALMKLCEADLRCLDAHAHLGNLASDSAVKEAIRHYEAGLRIGELSLGRESDGVLPWGLVDNRPFLRCMQGFGLCLWRLGRFEEAQAVFDRMLCLNPFDKQGIRFLVGDVSSRLSWEEQHGEPSGA